MQNPEEDSAFDDDSYDDILDDSFEDELDDEEYDELDLDEEEEFISEEDLFDDEWEDYKEEDPTAGLGAQKEKSGFNIDMSFNAMAITGAIVIGFMVLTFQIITKKPEVIERFTSALRMAGSSDGPVFGQDNDDMASTKIEVTGGESEDKTKGFLYNPELLNSMEMELSAAPPMPVPIVPETQSVDDGTMDVVTPTSPSSPEIAANKIPRAPTDTPIKEEFSDQDSMQKEISSTKETDDLPDAEEVLKAAIEARKDKVTMEAQQGFEMVSEAPVIKTAVPEKVRPKITVDAVSDKPTQEQVINNTIEQKLNLVINRLDDMELQITQIREAGNSKLEDLEKKIGASETAEMISKPQAPKKVSPSMAVAPKESKPKAVKKAPKTSWELRAAQPGKAWVSSKGQNDMRTVAVGDTLSGIGRITSVSVVRGKWVVQGKNGQISQ